MPQQSFGFCGLPPDQEGYDTSKIVILPVPFDKTSTWQKGSHRGPAAMIEASRFLELYDIETESEVYRKGIFTAPPVRTSSSVVLVRRTYETVSRFLDDKKFVVSLGGEHSISIGIFKAYAEHYEGLSLLHLDAHGDSRDSYENSRYNHACVIARAREFISNIVSVGIRSIDRSELPGINPKKTFFAHQIHDSSAWIDRAVRQLDDSVYVTIDLDVFDPAIMPSTGTPEPGGLGWYQVLKLLSVVSRLKRIVGFDVVELCPSQNKAPDFLAAKLIYTLLSYVYCSQEGWQRAAG